MRTEKENRKEEPYGTKEHPPAERGLHHLLFQRHLCHLQRRGGQPIAGAVRLCLRYDRHAAVPYEHWQPAGGLSHCDAARQAGDEAQHPAADHRLRGGLRHDGPQRCGGCAGAGVLPRGHRQGQRHQHLHHPRQRSFGRPHPGHEPDAQLLRLRCTALPLLHRGGGQGERLLCGAGAGGAGPAALAGVYGYSLRRERRRQEGSHRLGLPQVHSLLAADRPAVLPERRRAERHRLDGHLL